MHEQDFPSKLHASPGKLDGPVHEPSLFSTQAEPAFPCPTSAPLRSTGATSASPEASARRFRDFGELLAETDALHRARRGAEAFELHVQAGRLFPRVLAAQVMTVESLIRLGQDDEAREVLQRASSS